MVAVEFMGKIVGLFIALSVETIGFADKSKNVGHEKKKK